MVIERLPEAVPPLCQMQIIPITLAVVCLSMPTPKKLREAWVSVVDANPPVNRINRGDMHKGRMYGSAKVSD